MNEVIEKNIESMIYEIRGVQVMLDSDLARLYHCKNGTKEINQAVKNNIIKFPERFSWILTIEETERILRSKILTSSSNVNNYGGRRYNIRVFTEQGVYMLATILKSKEAIQTTINIMDTFVKMRKLISANLIEQKYINNLVLKDHDRIDLLEKTFDKLNEKQKINTLFYEGQVYDAYSLLLDILNQSKKEIIIIDNYASKELLDSLRKINKKIIIISSNIDEELKQKYTKQYNNIEFKNNSTIHDRFIIIDRKILYTCGSSFKDLGKKCFYIGKINEKETLEDLLNKIIQNNFIIN